MVSRDKARIRVQMSANLRKQQLDDVISKLESIGKELKII
jgi:7-keto-8-aminopelargonate synthetase-like enzyme